MRTGPRDAVAGDELAAADLRRGDVDVLVRGLRRVDAQERRAVAEQLDDALGARCVAASPARAGRRPSRLTRAALLRAGAARASSRVA